MNISSCYKLEESCEPNKYVVLFIHDIVMVFSHLNNIIVFFNKHQAQRRYTHQDTLT